MDFSRFQPSFDFEKAAKYPSALVLVLANLVPLYGVLLWNWSVPDVIITYWAETVIIGFYNALKMLTITVKNKDYTGIFLLPFFCIHFGGFTIGHSLFVAFLFGFPKEPLTIILPLTALFASHGVSFILNFLQQDFRKIKKTTSQEIDGHEWPVYEGELANLFVAPYPRIAALHLTLLLGGFLVASIGAPIFALAFLVALKIIIDLGAHLAERKFAQAQIQTN